MLKLWSFATCLCALTSASRLSVAGTRARLVALPRATLFASATDAKKDDEQEERLGAGGRGGHAVKNQPE